MDKAQIVDRDEKIEKIREGYRNIIDEKDEKIEDLINLCDSKDEEIQLLEKKYDELKERTASLIANESDFEFIRAKLDCVVSILKDI